VSVPYHAWTHTKDGTDPIDVQSGLPVAFGQVGLLSKTVVGHTLIPFNSVSWNDNTVFGYADVTAGFGGPFAGFITTTPGTYMVDAIAAWSVDFTAGDGPLVEIACYFPSDSSVDRLSNTVDVRSMDDAFGIWSRQFTTEESDHHTLRQTCVFSWDEDMIGETTFGLGVQLYTDVSRTKSVGASISIVRLGEVTEEQTIT